MSSIKVDIDIDDILWGMSKWDRKEFFKAMQEDGYISEWCVITNDGEVKPSTHIKGNEEFNNALNKLFGNAWKLTKEEEEYIINISKRFV